MDFVVITEEDWDCFPPNVSKAEMNSIRTIEWAWERWGREKLRGHQRRYLADILKSEAAKIKTPEARRYLNRRYRMRYRQPALLPYGEASNER